VGVVVFSAALVGCRHQQLREALLVDAFSAETRMLEDKVYELSDRVAEIDQRLKRLEERGGIAPRSPTRPRTTPENTSPAPPQEIPDLTPPRVDPGRPVTPGEIRSGSSSGQRSPGRRPASALVDEGVTFPDGFWADTSASSHDTPSSSQRMATLIIDERTQIADWDDVPGEDGLWLVLRTVDSQGRFVAQGGSLTVVLLDAVARKHVARWELDGPTLRRAVHNEENPPAVVLPLRWKTPPENAELHVFVRWQAPDGQRWQADRPLERTTATRRASPWTPRTVQNPTPAGPPADVYR
jgi:hypothetical protein